MVIVIFSTCFHLVRNHWTSGAGLVQSWVKITQSQCEFWIQIWKLKLQISWILFVYNLVIGYSKNSRENALDNQKKKPGLKSNPWPVGVTCKGKKKDTWLQVRVSANRPSSKWAQISFLVGLFIKISTFTVYAICFTEIVHDKLQTQLKLTKNGLEHGLNFV